MSPHNNSTQTTASNQPLTNNKQAAVSRQIKSIQHAVQKQTKYRVWPKLMVERSLNTE